MNKFYIGVIAGVLGTIAAILISVSFRESDFYYQPAVIAMQDEVLACFETVDTEQKHIYVVEKNSEYADVPYLLTMDNKGTNNMADDEVVVVWRTN